MSSRVTNEQIASLSKLSEDELLRTIYYHGDLDRNIKFSTSAVKGVSLAISKSELKKDLNTAKKWFQPIESKLKKAICDDWHYCDKAKDFSSDSQTLVKAIIPVIVAASAVSLFTALAIAVLLVIKWGLNKWCGCK
jgi:hypothetical protein